MQHIIIIIMRLVVVADCAPGILFTGAMPHTTSVRVSVRVRSVWNSIALRIIIIIVINLHMCAAPPWFGPCEQNGMRRPPPRRSYYLSTVYLHNIIITDRTKSVPFHII